MAIVFEYVGGAGAYYMISCTLGLGIGAFWFVISVIKEIQRILHSINVTAQATKKQSNKMKVLFEEFIYAHGVIKELSMIF